MFRHENLGTTSGGARTPKFLWREGAKRPRFGAISDNFANISGMDQDIDKRKAALSTTIPPTFKKIFGELWSTTTELTRLMFTD